MNDIPVIKSDTLPYCTPFPSVANPPNNMLFGEFMIYHVFNRENNRNWWDAYSTITKQVNDVILANAPRFQYQWWAVCYTDGILDLRTDSIYSLEYCDRHNIMCSIHFDTKVI